MKIIKEIFTRNAQGNLQRKISKYRENKGVGSLAERKDKVLIYESVKRYVEELRKRDIDVLAA